MATFVSQFPSALDTLDTLGRATNGAITSLSAAISASDTAITVSSTAAFPTSGNFTIEDEIITYAAKTSNTFTGCVRGTESSTAASHPLGVDVSGMITAAHTNNQNGALVAMQQYMGYGATTLPAQLSALDARLQSLETAGSATTPGVFFASDFGASGLADAYTGTISAGALSTLVLTAASKFEVGHGVNITGAGAAPEPSLVTKVTAVSTDKRTITLAAPASQAVTSVLVWHDDTDALQSALDAAYSHGAGEVKLFSGHYRVNRKPDSVTKSILKIPFNSFFDAPPPTVSLTGTSRMVFQAVFQPQPSTGTIISTSRSDGPDYFIFAAAEYYAGPWDWEKINQSTIGFTGIVFRTYDDPHISGLDLWNVWNVVLKEVQVDTGMSQQGDSIFGGSVPGGAEPTVASIGVRLQRRGANSITHLENLSIGNYYTGLVASELVVSVNTSIARCKVGIQWEDSTHASAGRFLLIACPVFMKFNGHVAVDLLVLFENDVARDFWSKTLPGNFIQDPNNYASGQLRYTFIAAGLSATEPLPITWTGCGRLSIFSLDNMTAKYAPELPLTAGPLALSGSLEVGGTTSLTFDSQKTLVEARADDSAGAGLRQLAVPNLSSSSLLTGLVSYWKMEETSGTRSDSAGPNVLTPAGTIFGMTGKIGNGARANGSPSSALTAADNSSQNFTGSFTVAGWMSLINLTPPNENPIMVGKWTAPPGGGDGWVVYRQFGGDYWVFLVTADGSTSFQVTVSALAPLDSWHFIVAIYDHAVSKIRLSVDGAVPAEAPFTGPVFHSLHPLAVLNFSDLDGAFNTSVDELGLWNRVLTTAEITELWNAGSGITYPF
jgi:Concanavalin A-like lectin/glucanases superfamily